MSDSPSASGLAPRFEIRRLEPKHVLWANAIVMHSNAFASPVWPVIYPNKNNSLTTLLYKAFTGGNEYLMEHQVASGFSFGVFDTEYVYRREESKATQGKLYWDVNDPSATRESLLEGMDFPLVSVAMSFDIVDRLDYARMAGIIEALPLFGVVMGMFNEADPRGSLDEWGPKEHGMVLQRNATATREDYMKHGIMKKMAYWLMREAERCGWKGMMIDCFHGAVIKTWMNPPAPFTARNVGEVNVKDLEEEIDGKVVKYEHVDQRLVRVFVTLKE